MKPIGIVIATSFEARPVVRAFSLKRVALHLYQGMVDGKPVLLTVSGVGKEPARAASYRLCTEGVGELVSAGFCGALVPELQVGDLVTHRIATVDTPVRNLAERQELLKRANALAVDMESQAVIEAGTRRGVPIRVCRVVSDRANDDLTPLFGNDTSFSAVRIGFRLLNPAVWPLAAQLKRHSQIASEKLVASLRDCLAGRGAFSADL